MTKWTVGIIIVLLIAAGGWYFLRGPGMHALAPAAPQGGDSSTLPTSPSDSSDQAIDQDTAAIDAQLQGISADSASVGASVDSSASAGAQ